MWLTQAQLVELFQSSKANISEHITNIYEEGELDKESTVRKFRTVQIEGGREVIRNISKCERTAFGIELDALVLCADKSDTLVEYTLPEDNKQIFAAKYLPYMPTK